MNIYLDIDGVLLSKEGEPANHLEDFLEFCVSKFNCFWLTTHCKGDNSSALRHLQGKVSEKAYSLAINIDPTMWNTWKTEGINFDEKFIWLDDYVFEPERDELLRHNVLNRLVLIDLNANPNQLFDLLEMLKKELGK